MLMLRSIGPGEINGRLLDDMDMDIDALHSLNRDPPVQNAILTHPR